MANLLYFPAKTAKNLFLFPFFLFLYSFTGNVSNDIYMPSMPLLVHIFETSNYWVQMTLTLWFLGDAIPQLIMGPMADRYGRRALLFVGGLIFLVSTFICMISHHVGVLVIARFFQGMGVCSLTIVSFIVIHELFEGQQCVRLLSHLSICNSAAPLLGPLLGGYIYLLLGWRVNFLLVFILGIISIVALWIFMPESKSMLDKTALQPRKLLNNYFSLIKNSLFIRPLITYGLFFGGVIAYLSGAPFVIIKLLKVPAQYFGYSQLAIFAAFILTSLYVEKLVDKYQSARVIITGAIIIVIASISMLILSFYYPHNLYGFIACMMLYASGFGLAGSPLAKETLSLGASSGGFAASMLGLSMTGFSSLGSFIVGLVYNQTIISVAIVILIMSLCGLFVYSSNYFEKSSIKD